MLRSSALDALVVAASVVLASVPFVSRLGFYSDDWTFLSVLTSAPDQSVGGLMAALAPYLGQRPPHLLAMVLLFKPFGQEPLGYHVVNTLIIAVGALCFCLLFNTVGVSRPMAVSAAAVYGALPHYSTDRVWIASIQASIGMALFFAGAYVLVRAVAAPTRWSVWGVLGAVCLGAAALSYEVFVPLAAVGGPALVLLAGKSGWAGNSPCPDESRSAWKARSQPTSGRIWALALGAFMAIAAVVLFKLADTSRVPDFPTFQSRLVWFRSVMRDGAELSFGMYGVGLPWTAGVALVRWPDAFRIALCALVGLLVGGYVYAMRTRSSADTVGRRAAVVLLLGGPAVFVLGLAIFATNYAFLATPSGNANRVFIAAASGVALTLVGATTVLARLGPLERVRAALFSVAVAVVCCSGSAINGTLAEFWVTAARRQTVVLDQLARPVASLPPGSSLLLDGLCPYVGPGVVFEAPWDLASALHVKTGVPLIRADVVTPSLRIEADAAVTEIYAVPSRYSYANLFVFDARRNELIAIHDAPELTRVLERIDPDHGAYCGEGHAGAGAPVF